MVFSNKEHFQKMVVGFINREFHKGKKVLEAVFLKDQVFLKCVICNEMKAEYRYLEESENEAELGKLENEGQDKKIAFKKFAEKSHNDIAHH